MRRATESEFGGRWVTVCAAFFAVWCSIAGPAQADRPWWDDFPCFLFGDNVGLAQDYNATVSFDNTLPAPGWGTYILRIVERPWLVNQMHAAGLKSISYFETFGTSQSIVVELGENPGNLDHTPILAAHWNWQNYGGGPIAWAGPQSWFDDEAYARPYTRTHPDFGGAPMTYPDGTIASGYIDGDTLNPLKGRVYDAGASKSILGGFVVKEDYQPIDPDVAANGPHDGLLLLNGTYYGKVGPGKDSACPKWLEIDRAQAKYAISKGMDGMWSDNFGAWNSFSWRPIEEGFGEWSVARFREYLESHFSAAALAAMDITDVDTFDVRTALRDQVSAWGGNNSNLFDPRWSDSRWLDHDLWHAYVIFKRQTGTAALSTYYHTIKQLAADAGRPDFLIAGNDVPAISLGWPRGDLDMVSCETTTGWYIDSGRKGFGLPPFGRLAPRYKLCREHAKGRFVNAWLYFNAFGAEPELDQYRDSPGINTVMFYEMLANHTVPMPIPAWPHVAGTQQVYTDLYAFVEDVRDLYGDRVPVEEVGIYYSSSSVLAHMTPGGFLNVDDQPHQFAIYGWGMALGELHYQYRMVPEWKLNSDTLSGLRILIVPNAEVFSPDEVNNVLIPWVESGGLLIVTGNSGHRLGEEGNFEVNSGGFSLAPLTGVSSMTPPPAATLRSVGSGKVLYLPDNIGREFFLDDVRTPLLSGFADAMEQVLFGEAAPVIAPQSVPPTAGLTLYRDAASRRQFVDINNMNIQLASDTVAPTGPLSFEVELPGWLNVPDLTASAVSPDGPVTVSFTRPSATRASVNVANVENYASVVFSFPDADEDGLSDATEADLGTNPNDADSDQDGLTDLEEISYDGDGSSYSPGFDLDPVEADTDGDGLPDGVEIEFGTDPLDPSDTGQVPAVSALWQMLLMMAVVVAGALAVSRRKLSRG